MIAHINSWAVYQMIDRRSLPRRQVLKTAQIIVSQSSVFDCAVRNVTTEGALIRVRSVMGIPDRFDLTIDPSDERHACRVIWRSLDELGVRFGTAA